MTSYIVNVCKIPRTHLVTPVFVVELCRLARHISENNVMLYVVAHSPPQQKFQAAGTQKVPTRRSNEFPSVFIKIRCSTFLEKLRCHENRYAVD